MAPHLPLVTPLPEEQCPVDEDLMAATLTRLRDGVVVNETLRPGGRLSLQPDLDLKRRSGTIVEIVMTHWQLRLSPEDRRELRTLGLDKVLQLEVRFDDARPNTTNFLFGVDNEERLLNSIILEAAPTV